MSDQSTGYFNKPVLPA